MGGINKNSVPHLQHVLNTYKKEPNHNPMLYSNKIIPITSDNGVLTFIVTDKNSDNYGKIVTQNNRVLHPNFSSFLLTRLLDNRVKTLKN